MKDGKRIGLSLSGGGYRATIYHLGTLRKLKEMGILDKVDVISAISGGAVTGAYFGLHCKNFAEFENGLKVLVKQSIIKGILLSGRFLIICLFLLVDFLLIVSILFSRYAWLSQLILLTSIYIALRYQYVIFPVSKLISSLYSKLFFKDKTLKDLCEFPKIAINATNLDTGRQFTFSKKKMSDSAYEHPANENKPILFKSDVFPLSLAVAASTCVPFAFSPIYIDKVYYNDENDFGSINPCLVDGGVYDNQGVHKLTQENSSYRCDIIIVSDAGNLMPKFSTFNNVIQLLIRTSDIFMNRIKNYQMIQHVYENHKFTKKQIAYQSLGWDVENCLPGFMYNLKKNAVIDSVISGHEITEEELLNKKWEEIQSKVEQRIGYQSIIANQPSKEEVEIARSVKTNLTALSEEQINAILKQAECLTEIQVRLYCPQLTK